MTDLLQAAHQALNEGDLLTAKDRFETVLKTTTLPAETASALGGLGVIAYHQSSFDLAADYYARSLALYREGHNRAKAAGMLINLGAVALQQGLMVKAQTYLEESLALSRAENDLFKMALGFNLMGGIVSRLGDLERARRYAAEAIEVYRQLGQDEQLAAALSNLAITLLALGDHQAAAQHLEESIQIARQLNEPHVLASSLAKMGQVAINRKDFSTAKTYLEESLTLRQKIDDRRHMIDSLSLLVLAEMENPPQARTHLLDALKYALEVDADSAKLEALLSAAYYDAQIGQLERAAELASIVDAHPAMPDFMRPLYIQPLTTQFNLNLHPPSPTDLQTLIQTLLTGF